MERGLSSHNKISPPKKVKSSEIFRRACPSAPAGLPTPTSRQRPLLSRAAPLGVRARDGNQSARDPLPHVSDTELHNRNTAARDSPPVDPVPPGGRRSRSPWRPSLPSLHSPVEAVAAVAPFPPGGRRRRRSIPSPRRPPPLTTPSTSRTAGRTCPSPFLAAGPCRCSRAAGNHSWWPASSTSRTAGRTCRCSRATGNHPSSSPTAGRSCPSSMPLEKKNQ